MTSASHVEDPQPTAAIHAEGITPVAMIHIDITYPYFVHKMGDDSPTSSSHTESMSPTIVNDIGCIHMIEKPRHLICNPKFLCRTYEVNHLTQLCPTTARILEAWFSLEGPSGSEVSIVSPHPVSPLIDMIVMSMQSYPDHTLVSRVMSLLSLLSQFMFNLELKKWS
jgi:hypothetical protein